MAKLYNIGDGAGDSRGVPTVRKIEPQSGKVKEYVKVPWVISGCQCGPSGVSGRIDWDGVCRCGREQLVEHEPGNVYVSIPSVGFYTVKKGAAFDVPPGVSVKAVRDMCPHLLGEEDYLMQKQQEAPSRKAKEIQ